MREGPNGLARFLGGVVVQDHGIVLVGGDGLLSPSFRAQRQPAQAIEVDTELGGLDLQQPFGQHVVEAADHGGQLPRLHPLGQQAARQAPDVLRRRLERGNVTR